MFLSFPGPAFNSELKYDHFPLTKKSSRNDPIVVVVVAVVVTVAGVGVAVVVLER